MRVRVRQRASPLMSSAMDAEHAVALAVEDFAGSFDVVHAGARQR